MKTRLNLSLICVGLAVLSCGGLGGGAAPSATSLPQVDAPPPSLLLSKASASTTAAQTDRSFVEAQVLAKLMTRHTGLSGQELPRLAKTIVGEAERYGLEPALVMAVIEVESAYYHRAVSPVGAMGLMQLLPSTGEELAHKHGLPWRGPDSLFDPVINVKLGVAYLNQLENKFGEIPAALAAYNWGPRRIRERLQGGRGLPAEYVRRVMTSYDTAEEKLGRT